MLYYVKTDVLFKNMEVVIGEVKINFNVTELEDKKGWEIKEYWEKVINVLSEDSFLYHT